MSVVKSFTSRFELNWKHCKVPKRYPYRHYIQRWYDEEFAYSDTIYIEVEGVVWFMEDGRRKVIVIYNKVDYDEQSEDEKEMELWYEFTH